MQSDRELMQQALEILEKHVDYYDYEHFTSVCELEPAKDLILALRERLAQPQRTHWEGCEEVHPECKKTRRREWVGLTRDEVLDIAETETHPLAFYRAIEAKLKEKNNA